MILDEHLGYLADRNRLEAFRQAINRTIRPGDRVLDLGCGSGILGLLCLKAGAGSVVAVDSSSLIIEVARQALGQTEFSDSIEFVRGSSLQLALDDLADVLIADHVGCFGLDYGIVHTLQDARRRMLKAGGRILPQQVILQLAALDCPAARARVDSWRAEGVPAEYHWLREHWVNQKHNFDLEAGEILGDPTRLETINLSVDQPDFFSWTCTVQIDRDGILNGLAGWFDCQLAEGVWMTNSPLADAAIDRPQVFLPIEEAVAVRAGEQLEATVMMRPAEHAMAWVVELPEQGRRFSHSTWQGMLASVEELAAARPDRVPELNRAGRARLTVLQYCDGARSSEEIVQTVLRNHPDMFPSESEIRHFVLRTIARNAD